MLFGDGVYEVVHYYEDQAFELNRHLERLKQSLQGIRLSPPRELDQLGDISEALVRRNATPNAKVYWQVTRGAAARSHGFPHNTRPTVLAMTDELPAVDWESGPGTLTAVLEPDQRWAHCWIKSLMLLPNVLAKQKALEAGADEAIFHTPDRVTEGSATTVMLVKDGAADDILEALGQKNVVVVSPIGGQGFVFGRGNQQISPAVIRQSDIEIVASRRKLDDIGVLRADTGDQDLDEELRGWKRVRVGRHERRLMEVV